MNPCYDPAQGLQHKMEAEHMEVKSFIKIQHQTSTNDQAASHSNHQAGYILTLTGGANEAISIISLYCCLRASWNVEQFQNYANSPYKLALLRNSRQTKQTIAFVVIAYPRKFTVEIWYKLNLVFLLHSCSFLVHLVLADFSHYLYRK